MGLIDEFVKKHVTKPIEKEVLKPIGKAGKDLENSVEKKIKQNVEGAKEMGRDINRAANDVEDGVEHLVKETVQELEKARDSVGDFIENAGDYVADNPFETVFIIASVYTGYAVFMDPIGTPSLTVSLIGPKGASAVLISVAATAQPDTEDQNPDQAQGALPPPVVKTRYIEAEDIDMDDAQPGSTVFPAGIGVPMPDIEFAFPTESGELRHDGKGVQLARRDPPAKYVGRYVRRHGGFDFEALPGANIRAPLTGRIVGLSYPYGSSARMPNGDIVMGLKIETDNGYSSKIWYVKPNAEILSKLNAGESVPISAGRDIIGEAQDIEGYYKAKGSNSTVPPHVHVEWRDYDNRLINPDGSQYIEDNKKDLKP